MTCAVSSGKSVPSRRPIRCPDSVLIWLILTPAGLGSCVSGKPARWGWFVRATASWAKIHHLLHTLALSGAPGLASDPAALVENLVALALLRAVTPRDELADAFNDPSALHVWGTSSGGEIDFVCGSRRQAVAVEVAYQRSPDRRKAAALPKAFPGRPCIMVTRDALEWHERYVLVPAALFLWALA